MLIAYFVLVVVPFIWVVHTSFKSTQEIFADPFGLPQALTSAGERGLGDIVRNYVQAWHNSHFKEYFLSSVKVTTVSLALLLLVSSMAGYALARYKCRANKWIFLLFVSGMIVPAQLLLVPLFFEYSLFERILTPVVRNMLAEHCVFAMHDTHTGLILIYVALSLPFSVFILTSFFRTLPAALYESAIIDGCSELQAFWWVMFPLAKPGLITVAIFNFIGIWNEYLFALVFLSSESKKTLPLGLASVSIQAHYKADFGMLFAGVVIVMIPTLLIYILLQERLTKGITVGAMKG